MPRKKQPKSSQQKQKETCPRCLKSFGNINLHYQNSPLCHQQAANLLAVPPVVDHGDPTLVSSVDNAKRTHYSNHIYSQNVTDMIEKSIENHNKKYKSLSGFSLNTNYENPEQQDGHIRERLVQHVQKMATRTRSVEQNTHPATSTTLCGYVGQNNATTCMSSNTQVAASSAVQPDMLSHYRSQDFDASLTFEPDDDDIVYSNMSKRKVKEYFSTLVEKAINDGIDFGVDSADDSDLSAVDQGIIVEMATPDNDKANLLSNLPGQAPTLNPGHEGNGGISISLDHFVPHFLGFDRVLNPHENLLPLATSNQSDNQNNLLQSLQEGCYADFRHLQTDIIERQSCLVLEKSLIASVKLLKMCVDSNIPNYAYGMIVEWHKDTILTDALNQISEHQEHLSSSSAASTFRRGDSISSNRANVMKDLSSALYGHKAPFPVQPIHSAIQLPSKKWTRVSRFGLKGILHSLFTDPDLLSPENCIMYDRYYRNPNLFQQLPIEDRFYSDIHTGSWFLNAYNKICSNPHDILCPIILFIDGTPIDQYGHLVLEPVMMTLGIFSKETRNKPKSWRLLGYIPEENNHLDNLNVVDNDVNNTMHTAAAHNNFNDQVKKRMDYHHILSYILKDIVDIESSNGILWNIIKPSANGQECTMELVRFRFTVSFVIGDAVGLDKLCDRYANYNRNVKFLCRDCNCPTNLLNDLTFKCSWTERSYIKGLTATECKQRSYHKVYNNAFDNMKLGYDSLGINGCCPPEILHQFLLGVLKKMTTTFYKCCTVKGSKYLDCVSKYIATNWHRNSCRNVPSIQLFKDGIMCKKKLTGDEEISHVFIIYLCLSQSYTLQKFVEVEQASDARSVVKKISHTQVPIMDCQGNPILDRRGNQRLQSKKQVEKQYFPKIGNNLENVKKWLKLLEYSLCFYFWLKSESIPASDVVLKDSGFCTADLCIRRYLELYYELVNEDSGMDINSLKLHQCTHIPHYIRRLASPLNHDGSIGERQLKTMAKNPARRTQQRSSMLAQQAAQRYYENTTVNLIYDLLCNQGVIVPPVVKSHNSQSDDTASTRMTEESLHLRPTSANRRYTAVGRYRVYFTNSGSVARITSNQSRKRNIFHKESFMKQVFQRLKQADIGLRCDFIDCFTLLKVKTEDGDIIPFRADPYFFQNNWFDWCETKWEGYSEMYPSRIFLFIDPANMLFDVADVQENFGDYWAITRNGAEDLRKPRRITKSNIIYSLESKLFDSYAMEDSIRLLNCGAINGELFVCSDISNEKEQSVPYIPHARNFVVNHIQKFKNVKEWSRLFIDENW